MEIASNRLQLQEWGSIPLSASDLGSLRESASIQALLRAGIIEIAYGADGRAWLKAKAFVGSASITPTLTLTITEKVPGTLLGLQRSLIPKDLKTLSALGHGGDGVMIDRVAAMYVETLGAYVTRGLFKRYTQTAVRSYTPKGRIDVRGTATLWARGHRPQLALGQHGLDPENELNRLLGYSALIAERILRGSNNDGSVRRLRGFARSIPIASPNEQSAIPDLVARAQAISERFCPTAMEALNLAVILAHSMSPIFHHAGHGQLPLALFANLEDLFERAVRATLATMVPLRPKSASEPMFPDRPSYFRCFPDYAFVRSSSLVVGDAKYKDVPGSPANDDVYQLVAHMRAFGAMAGFLIYPGQAPSIQSIGTLPTGGAVFKVHVRSEQLAEDIQSALDGIQVPAKPAGGDI